MGSVRGAKFESKGFKLSADFDFPDTGITCLWGSSGSGKTTLLNIMTGLLPCASVSFKLGGQNLDHLSVSERSFGVVFQDYALFPHLSVRKNIEFPLVARKELHKWNDTLIHSLGLTKLLDRKASLLSGGESQRVALARALVFEPRMVFLDEPVSALDESNRSEARDLIWSLNRKFGIPFFIISHDIEDLRRADWCVSLDDGNITSVGEPSQLLSDPKNAKTAKLNPDFQSLKGVVKSGEVHLAGTRLNRVKIADPLGENLIVKKWHFRLVPTSGIRKFQFEILRTTQTGPVTYCLVQLHDSQKMLVLGDRKIIEGGGTFDLEEGEEKGFIFSS